jgi:hypothetical protein
MKLQYKLEKKSGRITDETFVCKYERVNGNLVLRSFRVFTIINKKRSKKRYIDEVMRDIYYKNNWIKLTMGMYCTSFSNIGYRTKKWSWKEDKYIYEEWRIPTNSTNFDFYAILYPPRRLFEKTDWKYAALNLVAKHQLKIAQIYYLELYNRHPELELMLKLKVGYLIPRFTNSSFKPYYLRDYKEMIKRNVKVIAKLKPTMDELDLFKEVKNLPLAIKLNQSKIRYDYKEIINYSDLSKAIEYIENQDMNGSSWKDYLKTADKLGMDMKDKRNVYPEDLQEAHDRVISEDKTQTNNKILKGVRKQYKALQKFIFENQKYIIRPVRNVTELRKESKELSHCVRRYAEDIATGKTSIFFMREKEAPDTPLYTIEYRDNKIIQFQGYKHSNPPPELKTLANKWVNEYIPQVAAQ